MLGLKLIHVSKWGYWSERLDPLYTEKNMSNLVTLFSVLYKQTF